MTSPIFDRGRSERFAESLDKPTARRHHRRAEMDETLASLVRLGHELTDASALFAAIAGPDAQCRARVRATIMTTIANEGIGASAEAGAGAPAHAALAGKTQAIGQVSAGTSGRARAAVLAGVTAGALALSGVSAASTDSVPGDPLYRIKRSTERAQLALAGSDLSRGQLYLELARGRLKEAARVPPEIVGDVLKDMDAQTQHGVRLLTTAALRRGDGAVLDEVYRFVTDQRAELAALPNRPHAGAPVSRSLALLDKIEDRVSELKSELAGACADAPVDDLGPNPAC